MTQPNLAYTAIPLREPARVRPKLRVVGAALPARFTTPTWLALVAVLLVALLGPMVINTQMAMTSYRMHNQEVKLSQLMDEQAVLITEVEVANSPQALSERARQLGMVPAPAPGFISLANRTVTGGTPAPASGVAGR